MRHTLKFIFVLALGFFAKSQTAPTASFSSPALLCTGSQITFSSVTTGTALSYTWSISPSKGFSASTNVNLPNHSLTFTLAQTYTLSLTVTNVGGTSTFTNFVTVSKTPKASFNATLLDAGYPKNSLILTNYSTFSTKREWYFDNNFAQKDTALNTSKIYNNGGNYIVMLVAIGARNCSDTSRYSFTISENSSLVLPNVFTPNSDDVNDVYRPIAQGIATLTAYVFNRNGVLMASWDKVNGFWDGHTTSGQECSAGEYIIVVQAQGYDAKTYKLKSTITLVR